MFVSADERGCRDVVRIDDGPQMLASGESPLAADARGTAAGWFLGTAVVWSSPRTRVRLVRRLADHPGISGGSW